MSQRELPTHLFRGIQLSPEDAERVLAGGLPPRGVLTSWSTNRSVAEGFASPMGGRVGLLLTIQRVMAREHVIVGLNAYFRELASRSGDVMDDYMLGEEEFLLKDFEVPRRNIRRLDGLAEGAVGRAGGSRFGEVERERGESFFSRLFGGGSVEDRARKLRRIFPAANVTGSFVPWMSSWAELRRMVVDGQLPVDFLEGLIGGILRDQYFSARVKKWGSDAVGLYVNQNFEAEVLPRLNVWLGDFLAESGLRLPYVDGTLEARLSDPLGLRRDLRTMTDWMRSNLVGVVKGRRKG